MSGSDCSMTARVTRPKEMSPPATYLKWRTWLGVGLGLGLGLELGLGLGYLRRRTVGDDHAMYSPVTSSMTRVPLKWGSTATSWPVLPCTDQR